MKYLGKTVKYVDNYQPSLLQGIPREQKRVELGLDPNCLPFSGCDYWNGYELSWLNAKGKPQVAMITCQFASDTPNLIESKSFKLYLNSFNQTSFSSWYQVKETLVHDLSLCAEADVEVNLIPLSDTEALHTFPGKCIDDLDISVEHYEHNATLLTLSSANKLVVDEILHSHLLKSNCLITGQPDWGSILIQYTGKALCQESVLRYLISFRRHNEFHEQCVERIFIDVMNFCSPEKLAVYARYTRRGGLDINPLRANFLVNWGNKRLARQ